MDKDSSLYNKNEDWVINFLNLPHPDQINFLYRHSLDEKLRRKIEKEVFGE
ncbi:hypothetical protein [Cytobacillus firmus]|uniref:hypothetical protein n=1 Tax=Cytobacillus firmus TaxID=1399 RepID=UPI0018CFD174|nr:hypothetical protein [Cytobacillus firmus]